MQTTATLDTRHLVRGDKLVNDDGAEFTITRVMTTRTGRKVYVQAVSGRVRMVSMASGSKTRVAIPRPSEAYRER